MTSRELVNATLEFRNETGIVPRQMWVLPWAEKNYGKELERIRSGECWILWKGCMAFTAPFWRNGRRRRWMH